MRISLLLVFCFYFVLGCYSVFECVTVMMMNVILVCCLCRNGDVMLRWWLYERGMLWEWECCDGEGESVRRVSSGAKLG